MLPPSLHSPGGSDCCLNGLRKRLPAPAIMGILNLTPDSFSDGGRYMDPDLAVAQALELYRQGASIIDIGAESTRPGSDPLSEEEELQRLLPVLKALPKDQFFISVDSYKWNVQQAALQHGAHIINDIMGGSETLLHAAHVRQAGVVLMHCPAPPAVMQQHTDYPDDDIVAAVRGYFRQRQQWWTRHRPARLWLDPGIGFGKTLEQNLTLMTHLDQLRMPGTSLLLGTSRKSWIHHLCEAPDPLQRLPGSLISAVLGSFSGAAILRVHDVAATQQALKVGHALLERGWKLSPAPLDPQ